LRNRLLDPINAAAVHRHVRPPERRCLRRNANMRDAIYPPSGRGTTVSGEVVGILKLCRGWLIEGREVSDIFVPA